MKTIKIHILLLFLNFSPSLLSQSYLPLESGNEWVFDCGDCIGDPVFSECSKSIVVSSVTGDSIMPNGYRYYSVYDIYMGFFEWFRSDINWIYVFSLEDSIDLPIFNLHANINEPYVYGEEEYQTTTLRNRDTIIIFNDTIEVLEYVLETGLDITHEFTLSKKYGFMEYDNIGFGGWSYSNLIGCVIDGIVYGDTTTVGIKDGEKVPTEFVLYQNYPNPFNPSTMISYQLREASFVNLIVYNSIGETVAELVNQKQEQGNYSIEFNASNLPNGVYIYSMRANDFVQNKKMTLLK